MNIEKTKGEPLPICRQCGECCRGASPTLMLEDLELLRDERIPWRNLMTLRVGEPAHSPLTNEAFFLAEERIKIREKTGKKECVFLIGETNLCSIYPNRPMQCRAQACWDPKLALDLAEEPCLTRRDIFRDVKVLIELLDEHDRRCSFDKLKNAFDELKQSKGKTIDQAVELLAFDDHFRNFIKETLNIPEDTVELVFGRSLADRVRLFGFRVETDADGTHTLMPE
jgi:Fe-S-cluster containining protein